MIHVSENVGEKGHLEFPEYPNVPLQLLTVGVDWQFGTKNENHMV